ncbi:TNF receptor-associated factor 6-like [Pocillopora damicornis]|nr:TNF receptor-associated factor 6-like [Pocillopora damicornis]
MAESTTDEHRPAGYDEDFVEAVDEDLQCLICHLPLKEPIQTRCGHRFCKDCLEEYIRRHRREGQSIICPADRQSLDQDRDVFPDKATERKILSLIIKCPSDGCGWTGELRNKEVHLESCSFMLLACDHFSCGAKVQRKHLEQHQLSECPWRILYCEYCSEPHPECQMLDHIQKCSGFPVTCPNSCGRSIPRRMVSTHTEDECPLSIISCPYARMGCQTKVSKNKVLDVKSKVLHGCFQDK